jgi:hypothetical protein
MPKYKEIGKNVITKTETFTKKFNKSSKKYLSKLKIQIYFKKTNPQKLFLRFAFNLRTDFIISIFI